MCYLTIEEVLEINAEVMGGRHVLRDRGLLEITGVQTTGRVEAQIAAIVTMFERE